MNFKWDGHNCFFWCPGCDAAHMVDSKWVVTAKDGLLTISPSILVRLEFTDETKALYDVQDEVCHSFVGDSRIQFLDDCTHELAGQTVDLPPWPA